MPSAVNGIPYATPSDSVSSWPGTSETLAEWIDANAVTADDPRLTNARTPTAHEHDMGEVTGLAAALSAKVATTDPRLSDARTPTAHDHDMDDVTGLAAALSAKVGTTDPRLSDARPPTAHKHALADVDGITIDTSVGTRVLVGGHMVHGDTGARDVTAAFASGLASDNAGSIRIWKRGGGVVVEFSAVTLAPGSGTIVWAGVLPTGWRPARSLVSFSAARSTAFDTAQMIGINGSAMYWLAELKVGSSVTSTTTRPASPISGQIEFYAPGWPTTLPGTPA